MQPELHRTHQPNSPSRPRRPFQLQIDHVLSQKQVHRLCFFGTKRYGLGLDHKVELQRLVGSDVEGIRHQNRNVLPLEAEGVPHVVETCMRLCIVVLSFDPNGGLYHKQAGLIKVYGVELGSRDSHLGHLRPDCDVADEDHDAGYNHQQCEYGADDGKAPDYGVGAVVRTQPLWWH